MIAAPYIIVCKLTEVEPTIQNVHTLSTQSDTAIRRLKIIIAHEAGMSTHRLNPSFQYPANTPE